MAGKGKGAHLARFLLEGVIRVSFSILCHVIFVITRVRKKEEPLKLPPVQDNLLLQSATDLAGKIRRKEVSSVQVTQLFIARLEEVHNHYNVVVDRRYEEALKEASLADEFLKDTDKTETELLQDVPFLGVPITVKGSLAMKGLKHTAGSAARKDIIATEDATPVTLLKKAGAIPLALTNTPEVCCWWETYNNLTGLTCNPYNRNHTCGGSSGGEAVALAGAGSVIGLGSDIGGSIRIPAAFNGVFGHKPTRETVSIEGHFPNPPNAFQKALLISGPLTRYAKDLRPMLKILTSELAPDLNLDRKVDLKKIKVYYMEEQPNFLTSQVEPGITEAIRKVAHHFKKMGSPVEQVCLPKMKYSLLYWTATLKSESVVLARLVTDNKTDANFFYELFKYAFGWSSLTLPVILFGLLEAGNGVPYKGLLHSAVLEDMDDLLADFKRLLKDDAVFIYPTHPTAAPYHYEALARSCDFCYSGVFNALGLPATHCPVGRDDRGLPVGVQVIANHRQDRLNLAVAEEIERAFGGWRPPF